MNTLFLMVGQEFDEYVVNSKLLSLMRIGKRIDRRRAGRRIQAGWWRIEKVNLVFSIFNLKMGEGMISAQAPVSLVLT